MATSSSPAQDNAGSRTVEPPTKPTSYEAALDRAQRSALREAAAWRELGRHPWDDAPARKAAQDRYSMAHHRAERARKAADSYLPDGKDRTITVADDAPLPSLAAVDRHLAYAAQRDEAERRRGYREQLHSAQTDGFYRFHYGARYDDHIKALSVLARTDRRCQRRGTRTDRPLRRTCARARGAGRPKGIASRRKSTSRDDGPSEPPGPALGRLAMEVAP